MNKPELETLDYKPSKCALPDENGGILANPEQPNQNIIRIDKADSLVGEALKALEEVEVFDIDKRGDKQGCIWTLEGWKEHNLKHLRKAFE